MTASSKKWFNWSPSIDTALAFGTLLWMVSVYYVVSHWLKTYLAVFIIFYILTNLVVAVLLPVWWIAYYRKQSISELGITTRRWLPSTLIGAGIAFLAFFRLRVAVVGIDWLPHVIANTAILWEPLFIYGWLQIRFERAFGIVPSILLTGLSFAAYHIGANYPPVALAMLLAVGLLFAMAFRITTNLLVVWPLASGLGSSLGTLIGGLQFTWEHVTVWSVILGIQLIVIVFTWYKQNKAGRSRTHRLHQKVSI
jgi:membrane protease YdiL (CAAX protease family)